VFLACGEAHLRGLSGDFAFDVVERADPVEDLAG